jgi:hypothetical protein
MNPRAAIAGFVLALIGASLFAQVPADERIPVTDPDRLESWGFPRDAKDVYVWSKADLKGQRRLDEKAAETWGTANGFSTIMNYQLQAKNYAADPTQAYILYHQGSAGTSCLGGSAAECLGYAQILVPEGAILSGLHVWGTDDSADADLHGTVIENCEPLGSTIGTSTVLAEGGLDGTPGDFWFAFIMGNTVNNKECGYTIRLKFTDGGVPPQGTAIRVRKMAAQWVRQVSPAPATATFNDVPTDHPFFQFVEALAKSGITGGCSTSPPLYCPDAPLTRGQMAVFLAKGLGLQWP